MFGGMPRDNCSLAFGISIGALNPNSEVAPGGRVERRAGARASRPQRPLALGTRKNFTLPPRAWLLRPGGPRSAGHPISTSEFRLNLCAVSFSHRDSVAQDFPTRASRWAQGKFLDRCKVKT